MDKRKPKSFTILGFAGIYVLCFGLLMIRWLHVFYPSIVVFNEEITMHIMNFIVSMMLCTVTGCIVIYRGLEFRYTLAGAAVVAAGNFIVESGTMFMNVPDIIDALYGCAAAAIAAAYLILVEKCGFDEIS